MIMRSAHKRDTPSTQRLPRRDGALAAITASRQIALSERRLARKMGKQQLLSVAVVSR